jgi:hypothetical protein
LFEYGDAPDKMAVRKSTGNSLRMSFCYKTVPSENNGEEKAWISNGCSSVRNVKERANNKSETQFRPNPKVGTYEDLL